MSTILITGANKGIGLGLVKQYYQADWDVIACCRRPADAVELDQLYRNANGRITIIGLDVTDIDLISKLSNILADKTIDILINNAGVWGPHHMNFGSLDYKPWLNVFKVNTIAPALITQALIKQIANSKLKTVINMSSKMGSIGLNTEGSEYIYRSSKAALNAVTKSMAIDLKPYDITVIALHPGWVKTDMGGSSAPLTVNECVENIYQTLAQLSLKDSGRFIDYLGNNTEF